MAIVKENEVQRGKINHFRSACEIWSVVFYCSIFGSEHEVFNKQILCNCTSTQSPHITGFYQYSKSKSILKPKGSIIECYDTENQFQKSLGLQKRVQSCPEENNITPQRYTQIVTGKIA